MNLGRGEKRYSNYVMDVHVLNVLKADGAAVRRLRSEAKDRGQLIDATSGHKTRSIIIAVSGQVTLCAVAPETIGGRFKGIK
jgi:regulator of extracellular matrix RemA (YlzA/DUF370 family)